MNERRLTLGFAPTRRTIHGERAFTLQAAQAAKRDIEAFIGQFPVDVVGLDFLNEEGLLYHGLDAPKAARAFRDAGVDALFCPHCNFGCEDAVAKLAAELRVPLLIWGPSEGVGRDGYRPRDSQCGLFATSKVLTRMGVPFSYVTSCALDDPLLERAFGLFLAAASAVKALRKPRIGQISVRPDAFWSVKANEGELLERFGIEVVPTTLIEMQQRFADAMKPGHALAEARFEAVRASVQPGPVDEQSLRRVAALEAAILDWARAEQLSAAATACWAPMAQAVGISPCFAMAELTDMGFPVACECDLHGAVTLLLGRGVAMGRSAAFLADVTIRHPSDPNAELFWHCGVFPPSLRRPGTPLMLDRHYNRGTAAVGRFELKPGEVTILRFDGANGAYSLLMGHAEVAGGPETFGTYGWLRFSNWPLWERRFIYGPYIHHCVGVYGAHAPALLEACRYLPNLRPDPVEPDAAALEGAWMA